MASDKAKKEDPIRTQGRDARPISNGAGDKGAKKGSHSYAPKASAGTYNASDITILEGLEPVRKRPGMYIGTTGPDGLHHLIWEIFDNSRDEAMGDFADDVEISLLPGNKIRVADNGRGIPVDVHPKTKVSALETIMTTLHAGGKFGGEGYKVSGGLHGVGASVVNALSVYLKAEVHRDGGIYVQEYARGKKKAPVKKTGSSKLHGTIVTFEADKEIFPEVKFDWNKIISHFRGQAYLVKGLRISVFDLRDFDERFDPEGAFYIRGLGVEAPSMTFCFEGGLRSLVRFYNELQKPIHKSIFYVEKEIDNVQVEVALQYVDDINSRVVAYANNTYNAEGGTHVTGFKTALTRTLNSYAKKNNIVKESEDSFTGDDVLEGLSAVVSVKLPEIQFEGQTKSKLGSVEARGAVESVFSEAFNAFLEENPDEARSIVGKVLLALKARKAAKAAKDSVLRKGALEGLTLPGKLADCQSKDASESELFIVEGDSAGGCFSADTKVALVDGRSLAFSELIKEHNEGKKNYCYTIKNGDVAVAMIKSPRLTKKKTSVVKVVLDNGEEVTCTPDHKFMLRDGSYKIARELSVSDSLMPLRRQISRLGKRITIKGYELVYSPAGSRWIFTHILADNYNLKQGFYLKKTGDIVHHADFNKRNNSPENLVRMEKQAHLFYHTKNLEMTLHGDMSKQKAREVRQTLWYREKIKAIMSTPKMRQMLSIRAKKQWKSEEYKKFMADKFLTFYNSNEEYRNSNNVRLNNLQREHWSSLENRKAQSKKVREFFKTHPERKKELQALAEKQWLSGELKEWRSQKTKEQWTSEFRLKRKDAYNQTYLRKALKHLNDIFLSTGNVNVQKYDEIRKTTGDRSLIRLDTIVKRFFNGDKKRLEEAVLNFNHRIKEVVSLPDKIDVYDLEVLGTHNFALESGVFVHNSSKQGRDRRTQAILPLRGKILNVERARLDKMLASTEIKALVLALGTLIGDTFDIERLRYHKIIIATDADVDGAHIRTLLLTLFYRHFRALIDAGMIYIAQPPLFKIKRGKEVSYAYSDKERDQILGKDAGLISEVEEIEEESSEQTDEVEEKEETAVKTKKQGKVSVQRYKGLGEMNPEELWETTMDPSKRILKKVTIEDGQDADKIFDILMGTDVPNRKSFIQSNAKYANIDI